MLFRDRHDAGRRLAALLRQRRPENPIILALPRGGVPVGYEVARALNAPLDVLVVRKLGAPQQPELGIGAIAEGGAVVVDADSLRVLHVPHEELAAIAEREGVELQRRARLYREGRPLPILMGRTVVLVDDGVATGVTMKAAIRAVREQHPRRIVIAVPVAAQVTAEELRSEVDELVCISTPEQFGAVGWWYEQFPQTTDAEVLSLLTRKPEEGEAERTEDPGEVRIPCEGGVLQGLLGIPDDCWGAVIFAHGSGSSRLSRRNQYVARTLREVGLATLLPDLLTADEQAEDELTGQLRFDIDLLTQRLIAVTAWTDEHPRLAQLPLGYFGESTGAAAALCAAAEPPTRLRAVVSRGGRPDLAGASSLVRVVAPTLLVVGGADDEKVLELNRDAAGLLAGEHRLVVVPGAGHLFEEPGALDAVVRLAAEWFARHLVPIEQYAWPEGRPA